MAGPGAVIVREVRQALPAFLFFFVAFHMIAVTKTVILEDYKISVTGVAVATVGALIVAKAILLVEKLPVPRPFSSRAVYSVLWKTVMFGTVATLFRALEELIPRIAKHGGWVRNAQEIVETVSWQHFLIFQMWLLGLLFLYCVVSTLVGLIGPQNVKKMLLDRNTGADGVE